MSSKVFEIILGRTSPKCRVRLCLSFVSPPAPSTFCTCEWSQIAACHTHNHTPTETPQASAWINPPPPTPSFGQRGAVCVIEGVRESSCQERWKEPEVFHLQKRKNDLSGVLYVTKICLIKVIHKPTNHPTPWPLGANRRRCTRLCGEFVCGHRKVFSRLEWWSIEMISGRWQSCLPAELP